MMSQWRVRFALLFLFFLFIFFMFLRYFFIFFFLIVAVFELLNQVKDSLYLFFFMILLGMIHIAFNWFELCKLKNELRQT